jgi:hypothetical protein
MSRVPFTEPTSALPLRWGTYRSRYLGGFALIVSGAICIQGANAYVGYPLALGSLAHAIGWWMLPASGRRRIWVVLPSLLASIIMLIGPAVVGILAVPMACWLVVRHRPWPTVLLAIPVLVIGLSLRRFYAEYDGIFEALVVMGALMIGIAWFARWLAATRLFHRPIA